jgi:hypothetical protein
MSLGIVVKGPEGLVLAAESRITFTALRPQGPPIHANYDNATKLLSFSKHDYVGVVTYGQAAIGLRTASSVLPEFESELGENRTPILDFANNLRDFFVVQWDEWEEQLQDEYTGPNMTFVVGGFDEGAPYGRVFAFDIPRNPEPTEQQPNPGEFGITWGGQREFVDRLVKGYDPALPHIISQTLNLQPQQVAAVEQALSSLQMALPLQALPLQDCVNLAIFFIRTTISAQELTVGIRGAGGPIDVATITRNEGLKFIQRKRIVGEAGILSRISNREESK